MATALFLALKDGNVDLALDLINNQNADVNGRGEEGPFPKDGGATCLLMAIRNFAVPNTVAELLLERGADPNLADLYDQETPLQALARTYPYGTQAEDGDRLFNMLLDRGANPEQTNKHGDTALHCAASAGATHVCVALIQRGANAQAKDRKGKIAVEIAPDITTQSSIMEALSKRA